MADTCFSLQSVADSMYSRHNGLYYGFSGSGHKLTYGPLQQLYNNPGITSYSLDTATQQTQSAPMGLWDLGNKYLSAARQVAALAETSASAAAASPDMGFILLNGDATLAPAYVTASNLQVDKAQDDAASLMRVLQAILIVECALVIPAGIALVVGAINRVSTERLRRFRVFASIPPPIIREAATREYRLGDDDEGAAVCSPPLAGSSRQV